MRKFGPKESVDKFGHVCPACNQPFKIGDYTGLISIGPGEDPEEQEKCREGRPYYAVAKEAHWACITGEIT